MAWFCLVCGALPLLVTLVAVTYLLMKKPDVLRSEEHVERMRQLDVIEAKNEPPRIDTFDSDNVDPNPPLSGKTPRSLPPGDDE